MHKYFMADKSCFPTDSSSVVKGDFGVANQAALKNLIRLCVRKPQIVFPENTNVIFFVYVSRRFVFLET